MITIDAGLISKITKQNQSQLLMYEKNNWSFFARLLIDNADKHEAFNLGFNLTEEMIILYDFRSSLSSTVTDQYPKTVLHHVSVQSPW